MEDDWNPDRTAAWLGVAFVGAAVGPVEAASTLPDVGASAVSVATFYAEHRSVIVVLQVVGFVACVLLALFAWRLDAVDRLVGGHCLVLAVAAAPEVITVWLAATADTPQTLRMPAHSTSSSHGATTCCSSGSRCSP